MGFNSSILKIKKCKYKAFSSKITQQAKSRAGNWAQLLCISQTKPLYFATLALFYKALE